MQLVKYQGTDGALTVNGGAKTAADIVKATIGEKQDRRGSIPIVFGKNYPIVGDLIPSYSKSDQIAVIFDQTGSMKKWPKVFIQELPKLMSKESGLDRYSANYEIAWGAIGDARNKEKYPVQLCGFTSNITEAKISLDSLVLEGNGGSNRGESYDLGLYGLASRLRPAQNRPGFVIILGDEPYFNDTKPSEVSSYFSERQKFGSIVESCEAIRAKNFEIYAILRGSQNYWERLLGQKNVSMLDSPEKVVEAIVGILASRLGRAQEYYNNLASRVSADFARSIKTALQNLDIQPKMLR